MNKLSLNRIIKSKSKTIKKINPSNDDQIASDSKFASNIQSSIDEEESESEDVSESSNFGSGSKIYVNSSNFDSSDVSVEQVHIRLRDKRRMLKKGNIISGITDQELINFMEPEELKEFSTKTQIQMQREMLKTYSGNADDAKNANEILDRKLKHDRLLELQKEARELSLPRIKIEAIEFGWILSDKDGREFIRNLAQNNNVNLFELTIIKKIVGFIWMHYKKVLRWAIVYPSRINLFLMIIYATWIHNEKIAENQTWGTYYCINLLCIILLLI